MICPSCNRPHLILLICEDNAYRCKSCRALRRPPTPTPAPAPLPTFAETPGPAQGVPYVSPNTSHANNHRRSTASRVDALTKIEAELREKIAAIEAIPDWRMDEGYSTAHFAYAQAVQIVRDYRVVDKNGEKVRG